VKRINLHLAAALLIAELALLVSLVSGASVGRESTPQWGVWFFPDAARSGGGEADLPLPPGLEYSSYDEPSPRWGIARIGVAEAWQTTQGDGTVTVAVLDTGIDGDNESIAGRVIAEVNFSDSPTSKDVYGHGTHMAGTILAIAPECRLMNVKVADDRGRCEAAVVAQGIMWAVDHGADVINISLCTEPSPQLEEAVDYAWGRGVVIVAAAGNWGKSKPAYPAYYENCIAVTSTDENDSLAPLCNRGDWVDVAAPGFNIYGELPGNEYGYKSGTSVAAAHVSGVAALVFSVVEDVNGNGRVNDEVREAIEGSCVPIGEVGAGKGRVDAFEAVRKAASLSAAKDRDLPH